jgi:hypothetical protein
MMETHDDRQDEAQAEQGRDACCGIAQQGTEADPEKPNDGEVRAAPITARRKPGSPRLA